MTRVTAGLRPVSGAVGVRLALQRGAGRTALPVSSTLAGAALGIAALTAALVFAASLTYLAATPRLYGTTWNASVSSLSNLGGVGVGQASWRCAPSSPGGRPGGRGPGQTPMTSKVAA